MKEHQILFKRLVAESLESYQHIRYEWENDENNALSLRILKQNEDGFDVSIYLDNNEITLYTVGGHHEHYSFEESESPEQHIKNILGLVRDLLSNKTRIILKLAGSKVYKVITQAWNGKQWLDEDTSGVLFFNYFGQRSEKILQNNLVDGYPIE